MTVAVGRQRQGMDPKHQIALERAEGKLRRIEALAAEMVAEARAEVAQAMLVAGPAAVARRDGVTRQAIHDYIRRNGATFPNVPGPQDPEGGPGEET